MKRKLIILATLTVFVIGFILFAIGIMLSTSQPNPAYVGGAITTSIGLLLILGSVIIIDPYINEHKEIFPHPISVNCSYTELTEYLKMHMLLYKSNYIVGWYEKSKINDELIIATYRYFNKIDDAEEWAGRIEDALKEANLKWPVILWSCTIR